MKITVVALRTSEAHLKRAAKELGIEMEFFANTFGKGESIGALQKSMDASDVIIMSPMGGIPDAIERKMHEARDRRCMICLGSDPMHWALNSVDMKVAAKCSEYLNNNCYENHFNLLKYVQMILEGSEEEPPKLFELPFYGIVHPDREGYAFSSLDEYLDWYKPDLDAPFIGILTYRTSWLSDGCLVENALLRELERSGANVVMAFTMTFRDESNGVYTGDAIRLFMVKDGRCMVDAIVRMLVIPTRCEGEDGTIIEGGEFYKRLGVPVFQPVLSHYSSIDEWKASNGITDSSISVTLPELEGCIEPFMIGSSKETLNGVSARGFIPSRIKRLSQRVIAHAKLGRKHPRDRRVVIFLNNFPCAGLEGNVGAAANLDTFQSLANMLREMKARGYDVVVPENGKDIIDNILEHKAISEFRWTPIDEIDRRGGIFHRMPMEEYLPFFNSLSEDARRKVVDMWGEPPGKGMAIGRDIAITGVQYGNVMLAVQPKRGCYGPRCDGEVCKILHDPHCPPTHQYLATYHYFEETWGADAVVHMGTHGNLELLPGKSLGLSEDCFPDIAIGKSPHFYIFNSGSTPAGTVAKRRSYATLIDHMPAVMRSSALYGEYEALDRLLEDYESVRNDPSQCHQLKQLILEAVKRVKMSELNLNEDTSTEECVRACRDSLSRIRNSKVNQGLHTIGQPLGSEEEVDLIFSVMCFDMDGKGIRDLVSGCMSVDLDSLYKDQSGYSALFEMSNGALIEHIGSVTRKVIGTMLKNVSSEDVIKDLGWEDSNVLRMELEGQRNRVLEIHDRIQRSDEMGAFMDALDGRYIPTGPSGMLTRGRSDVLPTGKNFFSLDPYSIPKKSAWNVGTMLADGIIKKYVDETGDVPESIAFYWTASDILNSSGEVMSQMMSLIGVRPIWESGRTVKSYEVLSLEELGHPRIDVTVRISGVLRDTFINCVDLIDRAIAEVAELDEPIEMNFIRKHKLDSMASGETAEESTARFFSTAPGSYGSGISLAVFASAWKDEKDLASIYLASNGYAYGGGRDGKEMIGQFASSLSKVNVTYNKIDNDENDILVSDGFFGNHGGLAVAARHLSKGEVKNYYGDTREPKDVNVHTLADEIRRVARVKLLNPNWIEGMKAHGYKGASDMMKRIERVYGWEASTQDVDDWIFDDIANTFVNDEEMRDFFKRNNPYALEEISRRLLEAEQRNLWNADPDTLARLKGNYLEVESWMEEMSGDGEFQGGSIDTVSPDQIERWGANISEAMSKVNKRLGR